MLWFSVLGNVGLTVILRGVRVTIIAVENNEYYIFCVCVCVCVCSLSYPSRKAHAPYYIAICGLSGCTVIFHIIS